MPPSPYQCFAVTPPGIAPLTAGELLALGVTAGAAEPGGVAFDATARQLYAANLELRTANRILVRLAEFPARAFYELERKAKRVPWGEVVAPNAKVRFRVTSRKSRLYHGDGVAERLVRAVEGQALAGPPTVDDEDDAEDGSEDTQLFVVRIVRDIVTISADSSGALLHRRGYRLASGKAPLRETLAAAMLLATGYDGSRPLVDPLCGSGTIPIEAALLARRIAPGLNRHFAFAQWTSFQPTLWGELRALATSRILSGAPAPIHGSDRDQGAIASAIENAERAGVARDIRFESGAISAAQPVPGPGFLITNPPYGVRVGESSDLRNLYAQLGNVARARFPSWEMGFLSADPALERQVDLPFVERWQSNNGGIPVRLMTAPISADS
jgi:putative N6-adenine-specific DNA methylase